MIELFESDIWDDGRRSSKGNQLKFKKGEVWYKADYAGYEGLAEYVISHLIQKSSLTEGEYVLYDLEDILYKDTIFHGVKSRNMLYDDWQIITLERLYKNVYSESLYSMIYHVVDHESRLRMLVDQTERITGIQNFGVYIAKVLTIDALFLNEDRHTHNIAILANGSGEYELCPIFDQGAGLLSDTTMDYPLGGDIYKLMDSVKSKTFCSDFVEQIDIAEKLYGESIHFAFSKKDVDEILSGAAQTYSPEIIERVREILYQQMRKYSYMFS